MHVSSHESTATPVPDKPTTHSCCTGCCGHPTTHCIAECDAETVDITSRRRHSLATFRKLGRNEPRCANWSGDRALAITGEPRSARVKHNHGAGGIERYVSRLHVQVEHPMGVPAIHRLFMLPSRLYNKRCTVASNCSTKPTSHSCMTCSSTVSTVHPTNSRPGQ